ncbi:MAG: glycosyltransferase family 2 protein [Planctomycetes bacterium]|nr:glycosyltransferase family 2 protein [Planctomycetota bacterium]
MPISILILTLDEEQNLPRCLDSVRWSDDIVVLDSFSIDRTVEIASKAGARVVQRKFDNWSAHQNWAVQNIQFRHPWVYYSDADEIVTPQLRDEMLAEAARPDNPNSAYRVRYKNYFWGRWIRHCGIYPVWTTRLFRPQKIRWERLVNPVPVVDGPVGQLKEHYEHHSFAKGLTAWLDKHNRYSLMEAQECLRSLTGSRLRWSEVFSRDPMARRKFLKELSFHLPCRPLLRFIYMYILRLGFLDGWPGLEYCRLLAYYEHLIELKVKELRRRAAGRDT